MPSGFEKDSDLSPENKHRLNEELKLNISNKIQLLLDWLKLSQRSLAELTGIPSWTIATIVRRWVTSKANELVIDILLTRTVHERALIERVIWRAYNKLAVLKNG